MSNKGLGERGNPLLRSIDYLIGVPLIFLLGHSRAKSTIRPQNPQRIALLKTAGIGDTVLLSAVSQDLRRAFPEAELVFFGGANNYEVGHLLPDITEVVCLPITNPLAAIKKIIHAGAFDYWLDFGPWPRLNSLFSWASRAAFTVGFATSRQHRHFVYDFPVAHASGVHELDNYRSILRVLGVKPESNPLLIIPSSVSRQALDGFPLRHPRVIFHMFPGGSRAFLKTWPEAYWRELAGFFVNQGWQVVCTGGKSDGEQARLFAEGLKPNGANADRVINMAGSLNLHHLALLLKTSDLVISIDTGVMHMASALGAPVIGLFGPTSPQHWRPLGKHAKTIYQDLECSPCLRLGFESDCQRNKCLEILTPDLLMKEIAPFI